MIELRPYQKELIKKINNHIKSGCNSVVAVLGCGGGKSVIMAQIAKNATEKGERVLFLVHRKELCQQIQGTFSKFRVDSELCNICMVQTVARRLEKMPTEYDLILTDEAHHSTSATYKKIYNWYSSANRIGFTATPIRLNRGGLGEVYKAMATSVSTKWLIENSYLAPYKYYSAPLADTKKLHTVRGEFDKAEVAALMESGTVYGDTVKQWERFAKGKKTIVYCASVEAADKTAQEFLYAGYGAVSLSGKTSDADRKKIMQRFRDGYYTILCNCELFGEGLDVPDCECVVLLRPTQSLTLHIQQSMRSMRYKPGKTAIIIDHVGNVYRHGLPDDERKWSLKPKAKRESEIKIRECPNCFAVYPPTMQKCPYCGFKAVHEIRTINRKTIDVDLVEVKRRQLLHDTRLSDADLKTWEEIVEFQKAHGYKFAWCLHFAQDHGIKIPGKYGYMRKFTK